MGWAEIKYALNSTLGTGYKESLDRLLGAKIVCRGYIGTKFTLTRADGYFPAKTAEITEDSKIIDATLDLRAEIVPVPLGTYSIKIENGGISANSNVTAAEIGQFYSFSYSNLTVVATLTANGVVSVPEGASVLYVTAIAGGGGGGGGTYGTYVQSSGGGGGGGCGHFVRQKAISVKGLSAFSVQIGAGGSGGKNGSQTSGTAGTDGGATVIGNFFTLSGGRGGSGAQYSSSSGGSAGSGGNGGYSGGRGGTHNSNTSAHSNGVNGGGDAGGTALNSTSEASGGGGAGYKLLPTFTGTGGNANGGSATIYGGGGAGSGGNGGSGKSGYAVIYKGVYVG